MKIEALEIITASFTLLTVLAVICFVVSATRWTKEMTKLYRLTMDQLFRLGDTARMYAALLHCDEQTLAAIIEPHLPTNKEGKAYIGVNPQTGEPAWEMPMGAAYELAARIAHAKRSSSPSAGDSDHPAEAAGLSSHQPG